jgi:tetratricopeptide (TPR) repeat protein
VVELPSDAPVLDGLDALVAQSLLAVSEPTPEPRFTMLEVVREYALERLEESGEEEAVRDRHARTYLSLAEVGETGLLGPEVALWVDRLEAAHDNLRAALAWSMDRPGDVGPRLAGALGWFWRTRLYVSEGREWLDRALSKCRARGSKADPVQAKALMSVAWLNTWRAWINPTAARAWLEESVRHWRALGDQRNLPRALVYLANFSWWEGQFAEAHHLLAESIALCRRTGDKVGLAFAFHCRGAVARHQGDYQGARAALEKSLALAREMGSAFLIAHVTGALGWVAFDQKNYDAAQSRFEHALSLYREARHTLGESYLLFLQGSASYAQGDHEQARVCWEESLEIVRETGHKTMIAENLCGLGFISLGQRDWQRARGRFAESLMLEQQLRDMEVAGWCMVGLAGVAEQRGQAARAARLLGVAEALPDISTTGANRAVSFQADRESILSAVHKQLDEGTFVRAWDEGRALASEDPERAIAYALGETEV